MYIMEILRYVHNGGINGCYHLVCAASGDVSVSDLLLSLLMLTLFRGLYKIMTIIISKSSIFIYPKMFRNPDFKLCLFRLWGHTKIHSLLVCKHLAAYYNL